MANLMSSVKMSVKPSRNGFDMTFKNNFTAKAGEIRPVFCKPVLPGDVWNINLKSFTRLQPINTAAYARMKEYYDFYFVPMEILWNKFDSVATQMKNNLQHASGPLLTDNVAPSGGIPYITCQQIAEYLKLVKNETNLFGYSRAYLTCILLEYLGYGYFYQYLEDDITWDTHPMQQNLQLSILPLLAYQHVYADYFRYTQWERTNPSTFNVDWIKGTDDLNVDISSVDFYSNYNFLDLRYSNFNKDLFLGVLPNAQLGDESTLDSEILGTGTFLMQPTDGSSSILLKGQTLKLGTVGAVNAVSDSGTQTPLQYANGLKGSFSILQLRMAEALQRWKEVSQSVDEDYKAQIEAQWGVKVSDFLSHQSRYLGGISSPLDINPVVNQNLTGDSEADLHGMGTINNRGNIHFESKGEYGYIIGVYHVVPLFDYQCSGVDSMCTDTDITDFPIPVFDRIGMQQLPSYLLSNPLKNMETSTPDYYVSEFLKVTKFLGYVPRYATWKTSVDVARGAFAGSLKNWVVPFDMELFKQIIINVLENNKVNQGSENTNVPDASLVTWAFFKVNPAVLNTLFSVNCDSTVDTDQFLISSLFDAKVVRNLDVNGLPW